MVRKLKFHEQKLLRKVNFVSWEVRSDFYILKSWREAGMIDFSKFIFMSCECDPRPIFHIPTTYCQICVKSLSLNQSNYVDIPQWDDCISLGGIIVFPSV